MALDTPTQPGRRAGAGVDFASPLGRVVNGRYRVTRLIKEGGFGTVFEALPVAGGAPLALKFVHTGPASPEGWETLRRRFLREADIGRKLQHQGFCRVHDLETSDHDGVTLFIAMELLDGETLAERVIATERGLPWREAAAITRSVADALGAAHALGAIHRDVKPDNIFRCRDHRIVVLDLGLAHLAEERLTRTGIAVGSPHFAAPEQLRGERPDARTDIYSLGAVLYSALTKRLPIAADSFADALASLLEEERGAPPELVDVRTLNPSVPEPLAALVRRMMARDPAARPSTMREISEALMALAESDPWIGRRVGGYVVDQRLGRGGMGTVYRLKHERLPNTFQALKILTAAYLGEGASEALRARFEQEALAAASVPDHHVVKPLDFGHFDDEQRTPYIVMEYVAGRTLAEELAERGPFPVERAVKIVARVAYALAHAHAAGVIHRDLKPQNVMLQRDGESEAVKLLDFGVARATGPSKRAHTEAHAVIGTLGYLSPEAATGGVVDGRSDEFSLAVVLYQLLTGRTPFAAPTDPAILVRTVSEDPPPIAASRPGTLPSVSAAVEAVMRRALAKRPDARYSSIAEFERALLAAANLSAASVGTAASVAPPVLAAHQAPTLVQRAERPAPPPRAPSARVRVIPPARPLATDGKRSRLWLPLALAAGLLVGGGAVVAWRFSARTPAPAPPVAAPLPVDPAPIPVENSAPPEPPRPSPAHPPRKRAHHAVTRDALPSAEPAPTGDSEIMAPALPQ